MPTTPYKELRTQPESKIQKQIEAYLKEQGAWFYHAHGNGYATTGIPDLIGCYHGLFFAIEVKTPERFKSHGAANEQKTRLRQICKNGGLCCVAQSLDDAILFFTHVVMRYNLVEDNIPGMLQRTNCTRDMKNTWEEKKPLWTND